MRLNKMFTVIGLLSIMLVGIVSYHGDVYAANAVKLSSTKMTLVKGVNKTKTLTLKNKKYHKVGKVKWKSSKKSVATVNKSGKITVKKAGKTTITATAKVDGKKKKYKCVVTVKNLKDMKLDKTSLTLGKGESAILKMKNVGVNKSNLKWSSSNKSVATVDKNGKVTGVAAGKSATISVWVKKKKSATKRTCRVTVEKTAEDKDDTQEEDDSEDKGETKDGVTEKKTKDGKFTVSITAPSASLKANGTHDFKVTVTNNKVVSDQKITWITSGDEYIGTISDKNVFSASDVDGEMTVYCYVRGKDKNGKSVNCKSNTVKVKVETGYTYEMYALSNFYNNAYQADGGVSEGNGAVYIKTNRSLTSTDLNNMCFVLMDANNNILNYASPVSTERFCNIEGYKEESALGGHMDISKCWIQDGFTASVSLAGPLNVSGEQCMPSGEYNLALVKEVSGGVFAPLATLKIKVYDSEQLFKDWANYFIKNYTTDSMTNHEKMIAMVEFMDSYYYDNGGGTHAIGLSYISGAGGSVNTPNVLCKFGKEILGYSELTQDGHYHGSVIVWGDNNKPKYEYCVENGVGLSIDNALKFKRDYSLQDLINAFKNQELYKVYEDVENRVGTQMLPK